MAVDGSVISTFTKFRRRPFILIPILVLAAVAIILLLQINRLIQSYHWINHTDQVISQTELIDRQIIDLESSVRGYVITGDKSFLASYERSRSLLSRDVQLFRQLTHDNLLQQKRIGEFTKNLDQWLIDIHKLILIQNSGGDVFEAIKNIRTKELTNQMQDQIVKIRDEEESLKKKTRPDRQSNGKKYIEGELYYIYISRSFSL